MSRRAKSKNDSGDSSMYSYSDTASSSMESSSLDVSPRSIQTLKKSTDVRNTSTHESNKHEKDITSNAFAKQDDDDIVDITSNAFARSNSDTKERNATERDISERNTSQRALREDSPSVSTRNDIYDDDDDNNKDDDNNNDDDMHSNSSNAQLSSISTDSIEVPAMKSRDDLEQSYRFRQEDIDEVPIHISPIVDDMRQSLSSVSNQRQSLSKRRHNSSTSSYVSSKVNKSSRKRRYLRRRRHTHRSRRSRKHRKSSRSSRANSTRSYSESNRHYTHQIDAISTDDTFDVSKERMKTMTDEELQKGFKHAMTALHKAVIDLYVCMYQTRSKTISLDRVVTPSDARKLVVIAAYDVREGPSRLLLILRSLLERKHSPILIDSLYTNILQQHTHTFLSLKHTSNRVTLPYIIASNVKLSNQERRTWLNVLMDDPVVGSQFDLSREFNDHHGGNLLLRSYTDLRIDDASWYTMLIKKYHVWVNHHCGNHETLKGYLLRDQKEIKSRHKRKTIPLYADDIKSVLECLNRHGGKTVSELNA